MARMTHFLKKNFITRDNGAAGFIITNNSGSFAHFSGIPSSKYEGFFISHGEDAIKVIESIESPGAITGISNNFHTIVRSRGNLVERFFLPHYHNTLCYELSESMEIKVALDCRRANDFRQFGRYYEVYEKGHVTIIKFTKKTDSREDSSHDNAEFELFLAVRCNGSIAAKGGWIRRDYALDSSRNSSSERYVYDALRINASKIAFSAAFDEAVAISQAEFAYHSMEQLQASQKELLDNFDSGRIELAAAETALQSLVTSRGIYAGLPWFFQHWSRDSLISCISLEKALAKRTVLSHLRSIGSEGRLANVNGGIGSSDAVGWLFLRARQLWDKKGFSSAEKKEIASALRTSLQLQNDCYGKDGLIYSGRNETWMDTSFNDGGREGFPLEIQALTLAAYDFLFMLTKDASAKKQQLAMQKKAREVFWNGSYLNDLAGDATIRPNVFIAAYAYPRLLTKAEWEKCFDAVLPKLWLEWGGLASIDKNHSLFQPNYTGEDNRSYHRGDSWYWINNTAAIVMANLNRNKYQHYISRIKEASVNDLLWKGAVGCCSELSSASVQKAQGCLSQAWSAATLIELLRMPEK